MTGADDRFRGVNKILFSTLLTMTLAACGSDGATADSASAAASTKSSGAKPKTSASASAAPGASASAASSADAPKEDPDACPKDNTPPTFEYADVKFEWTETPKLDSAPKDKSYANVGEKTFVLPKVEVWVSEKEGTVTLRTNDGVLLGPSLIFKGEAKAGAQFEDKWGQNRGYFQMPKKGFTVECSKQTTSYNGDNARVLKLTKYDGSTADGSFVTTWRESSGDKRQMWAAGTFKDAKVVVFKK